MEIQLKVTLFTTQDRNDNFPWDLNIQMHDEKVFLCLRSKAFHRQLMFSEKVLRVLGERQRGAAWNRLAFFIIL